MTRLDEQLIARARDVYKHGSATELELLLASDGPQTAITRASLAAAVQNRDAAGLEEARATRAASDQLGRVLKARHDQLRTQESELDAAREELAQRLDAAEGEVASLEQLAERQRSIDVAGASGTYACPMTPSVTHFVDSWGYARSGGRSHEGADIMGPMGSPVFAFTDGVISRHSDGGLGGTSLYLRGNDGSTYYYAHLSGYTAAGSVGSDVVAGQHIAFNGDSGNPRGGAPHVHLERHPGGGSPVNPYPLLAAACF